MIKITKDIEIEDLVKRTAKALGIELHAVKIQETENNYAEYFG